MSRVITTCLRIVLVKCDATPFSTNRSFSLLQLYGSRSCSRSGSRSRFANDWSKWAEEPVLFGGSVRSFIRSMIQFFGSFVPHSWHLHALTRSERTSSFIFGCSFAPTEAGSVRFGRSFFGYRCMRSLQCKAYVHYLLRLCDRLSYRSLKKSGRSFIHFKELVLLLRSERNAHH